MWLTIIEGILSVALPILEKAILSWLSQQLHIAAVGFVAPPAVQSGPPGDTQRKLALLQKVREGLYPWNFVKRRAVDAVIARIKLS